MKDVAQEAGVSQATVSLVLNDVVGSGIPESTQIRVRAAASSLGYRHNALARGLKLQRSDTIGFLSDHITTTPYAVAMVRGAQDAARAAGKHLLILNLDLDGTSIDADAADLAISELLERRVEGIVYAAMFHTAVQVPDGLGEVRSVLLDAQSNGGELPSIVPDEYGAAKQAVIHLLDAGHRRIAHLTRPSGPIAVDLRERAYRDALLEAGIDLGGQHVEVGVDTTPGGFDTAMEALTRSPRPTALFCFNDQMAMGAYQAAAELGFGVPDDVSIVGFDDMSLIAPVLRPQLTTMRLPHYEMGKLAVECVLAPEWVVSRQLVDCPLVERQSVAPPMGAN